MRLRNWFRRRLVGEQNRIDLVTPAKVLLMPPVRAGLDASAIPVPWSVARLQALFEAFAHQPSIDSGQAARLARHQLSKFWLAAPVDQLQPLYEGEIGDLQRLQLTGPLVQQDLAADEIRWRDQLLQRLEDPKRAAERVNLLLALMPYTQPRKLSVVDPLSTLPDWLLNDYCVYCEPDLAAPIGLLGPAKPQTPDSTTTIEPLTERRGEKGMAWFRDEEVVARMQELIQEYTVDRMSAGVLKELAGLRRVLAQLWLDVEPEQLQTLEQTAVGAVTRSLILAGFGTELVDDVDVVARQRFSAAGTDLHTAAAPGIVMATMLFYPLDAVTFETTEGLPVWFVDLLREMAAESMNR